MSSVFRAPSQPITRNFKAANGVYYATFDFMNTHFVANDGVLGDGFVLFPTEIALAQAIQDIGVASDAAGVGAYPGGYTANGIEVWNDFGHELKLGVIGGKSDYFTYRTLKYASGFHTLAGGPTNGVFYVLVDSQPSHTMMGIFGIDNYEKVYVGRNY